VELNWDMETWSSDLLMDEKCETLHHEGIRHVTHLIAWALVEVLAFRLVVFEILVSC
jgi:hypothetical protein